MTGLLAVCPTCGQSHETIAALQDQLTAAAKRETGLKARLNQEMRTGPNMPEIQQVFEHWLAVCRPGAKRAPKLDAKRIQTIRARLKDGWSVAELNRAVSGWTRDDWAMGRDKRTKGATRLSMVEKLLADSGQVEQGLALADAAATATKPTQTVQDRPADPGSAVRRVLGALEASNLRIVDRPGGWEAQCPAHDDRNPSLGVDQGSTGVLLCCQRGCTVDEIAHALDLEVAALFDNWQDPLDRPLPRTLARNGGRMPAKAQVAKLPSEYELQAAHDVLMNNRAALEILAEKKRWVPGVFRKFKIGLKDKRLLIPVRGAAGELLTVVRYSPAPRDGVPKMLGLTGRGRHPFPPPEFFTKTGEPLWLVEGEPDALSAATMNLQAVAIPGVEWAKGQKLDEFADRLTGWQTAVCMDCDPPGREAAERIRAALVAAGVEATVVDLNPDRDDGFDVGDVLTGWGWLQGGNHMRALAGASGGTTKAGVA